MKLFDDLKRKVTNFMTTITIQATTGGKTLIAILANKIIDEHNDYSFADVPRFYHKRVKAELEALGAGELADVNVKNYIGPKPPLTLDAILAEIESEKQAKELADAAAKRAEELKSEG